MLRGEFLVFSGSVEITAPGWSLTHPPESCTEPTSTAHGLALLQTCFGEVGKACGLCTAQTQRDEDKVNTAFRGFSENNAWKVKLNCHYRSSNLLFFEIFPVSQAALVVQCLSVGDGWVSCIKETTK